MKILFTFCFLFPCVFMVKAQATFDKHHFNQVWENHSVRTTTELGHQNNLQAIRNNIKNIELNLGGVLLLQDAIYRSLTEVNAALKQGIMVKNMAVYTTDILKYSNEIVSLASGEPYLLLFAEEYMKDSKRRLFDLTQETTDFLLVGGKDFMMDFTKRDAFLKNINQELALLRGATYGALSAMKYAKHHEVLKKLNPFQNFINRDKQLVDGIISDYKYMQR